jgi:hypothetical protein
MNSSKEDGLVDIDDESGKDTDFQASNLIIGPDFNTGLENEIEDKEKIKNLIRKRKLSENDLNQDPQEEVFRKIKRNRTIASMISEDGFFKKNSSDDDSSLDLNSRFKVKKSFHDKSKVNDRNSIIFQKDDMKKECDDDYNFLSPEFKPISNRKRNSSPCKIDKIPEKENNKISNNKNNEITSTNTIGNIEIEVSTSGNLEVEKFPEEINLKFSSKKNIKPQKFSNIFSKMRDTSKYSNLCSDFKILLKNYNFLQVVETYSTLKLNKVTIERVFIPQFRELKIFSEEMDTETKNHQSTLSEVDGPISVNNKRILLFIIFLIILLFAAILVIFLI